jgi:8-oxo-dGTP diphosphatase
VAAEFISPIPVVSCVVINEGRILLLKRAMEPGKGKWALPAGYVEPAETIEQAIIREMKEETGLDVEVSYLRSYAKQLDDGRAFLSLMFIARTDRNDVVIDDESLEWNWFPHQRSALEDLDWAFLNHRQAALDLAR